MKPLAKTVVVDFSKLLPGPFCTRMLADIGCRVIKLELPHWPDRARKEPPLIEDQGAPHWMLNGGKESLCLDFRKPEGLKALHKLLSKADVFVEGFRPSLMKKLGLAPAALRRRHPKLIYCSVGGYGDKGPWAEKAGHDINYLAQSGLAAYEKSLAPGFPPVQVSDLAAAQQAAFRVLAALIERERTGRGSHVRVSMFEAAFSWQVFAMGELLAGKPPAPRSSWWNGGGPLYRFFETKDGRRIAVGVLEASFASGLLKALDCADPSELESAFKARTAAEWSAFLEDKDLCANLVLSLEEALAHPQAKALGIKPRFGPRPPRLGEHNRRIFRELGVVK